MERRRGDRFSGKRRKDDRDREYWEEREIQRAEEEDLRLKLRREQEARRREDVLRRGSEQHSKGGGVGGDEGFRRERWPESRFGDTKKGDPARGGLRRDSRDKEGRDVAQDEGRDEAAPMKCYNCGQSGHHQVACVNPPLCYACKKSGHIMSNCPENEEKEEVSELKLCGYGIRGQLFYCLNVEMSEEMMAREPVVGILIVEQGFCNESKIIVEMKHLFEQLWEWKVKKMEDNKYLVEFSSKETRKELSRLRGFDFEKFKIKANVRDTNRSIDAFAELHSTWVRAMGVPLIARAEKIMKKLAHLGGDPQEIDTMSLIRAGPVRIKVLCGNPENIEGTSDVTVHS